MGEIDTIAAIATPLGTGGIGIVRISGPDAFGTAERIVRLAKGGRVSSLAGYTCAYGLAADQEGPIDEVIAVSYTHLQAPICAARHRAHVAQPLSRARH